jgi:radical SAM superfamily enzyme YgiQ (UPF0313 family)
MAKILLIAPPIYKEEYAARGSGHTASILPPIGLAYIAAWLRKHGHYCEILDGFAEPCSLEEIIKKSHSFDIVGITAVSTYVLRVNQLLKSLKENNDKALVVVGGPHATILPQSCLEHGADYVVLGEGELPMLELVNAFENNTDTSQIGSLAYIRENKFFKNPRMPFIQDLDEIPIPAFDLLPMKRYRTSEARTRKQPSYSIMTSRGCPGVCSFCNKSVSGTNVRHFSADRIVEEFFLLRDKYGAEDVAILDDNFLTDHNLVNNVCEKLIKKQFNKTWSLEARVDNVNEEILKHLKEAGCDFIAYGIESGSQRMLDSMKKGITLEQIREAVRITQKIGMNIRGYFMMGLPYETLEDMEKSIRFAIELNIEVVSFSLFVPLPGTLDYVRAKKTGSFPDPEYFLHGIYPEFNFPDSLLYVPEGITPEELFNKHKSAYNRYYFRPKFLFDSLLSVRSFADLKRFARGGTNLFLNAFSNRKSWGEGDK